MRWQNSSQSWKPSACQWSLCRTIIPRSSLVMPWKRCKLLNILTWYLIIWFKFGLSQDASSSSSSTVAGSGGAYPSTDAAHQKIFLQQIQNTGKETRNFKCKAEPTAPANRAPSGSVSNLPCLLPCSDAVSSKISGSTLRWKSSVSWRKKFGQQH